jgi:hypothetical protein
MGIICGADAIIKVDDSGSELTIGQIESFSLTHSISPNENQFVGSSSISRSTECATEDWNIALAIKLDPLASYQQYLELKAVAEFYVYPDGEDTGKQKITFPAGLVTESNIEIAGGSDTTASVTIVNTGTALTKEVIA